MSTRFELPAIFDNYYVAEQGLVNTTIMGDWNSIVGEGQEENIRGWPDK